MKRSEGRMLTTHSGRMPNPTAPQILALSALHCFSANRAL
jgi:hypothetical protein